MTPTGWTVLGVTAACAAVLAATALMPRRWRERAAWREITRANPDLQRQFIKVWEEDLDRLAGEIGERLRRLRDCDGGDS